MRHTLHYVYSRDLEVDVQIKVGNLEGKFEKPCYEDMLKDASLNHCVSVVDSSTSCTDVFLTAEVFCDGQRVGLPQSTPYKAFTTRYNWNEWLTFPIKYSELARDAQIALTVWDYHDNMKAHAVGGTTISLFSKRGVFRQGIYDLKMWPFVEGDGLHPSKTPGKLKSDDPDSQMTRLAKLSKKHRNGFMERVDWLDRLTFREIELINESEKRSADMLFLMVEFPRVQYQGKEHFVVYFEPTSDDPIKFQRNPQIVTCPDPELGLDNLVEAKHHILVRSARSGIGDRNLKPNAATRDQLNNIMNYAPTTHLTTEEQDLVWKFRFYLSSNRKALTKFLKCVHWDWPQETKQAIDLLHQWDSADVEDALELLSPQFTHPAVRRYAVSRLKSAPREDLLLYLLQLVQALKYEGLGDVQSLHESFWASGSNAISTDQATQEIAFAVTSALADSVFPAQGEDRRESLGGATDGVKTEPPEAEHDVDLPTFLISRACSDPTLANYLYWYLRVECNEDGGSLGEGGGQGKNADIRSMYTNVLRRLLKALSKASPVARKRFSLLQDQYVFVERLVFIMKSVAKESGNRKKKIEFLQAQLTEAGEHSGIASGVSFANLGDLPLPVDPEVRVRAMLADRASLFNSALMPSKLTFLTSENREYVTIFKHGDDLRQDQLVLQIITLMDRLLKKENLDLKLTTYRVLATGPTHGFVQFIESQPLKDVIREWEGSIQNFLRHYNPSTNGPYGIEAEVIDNYVKGCAGYSIICYLLGVGDRHLHNVLLCKNGKLFHIDFGFILGRDPKPLPPPMKLTKEMIDAMGGFNSTHWMEFRRLCYTAFLHLRRHANLIMNLFSLMVDASIPDIALEPDKTVKKVQERFRLDLSDEEAVQFVQQLIDTSVSAKMAYLVDIVHDVAQMWRN